MVEKYFGETRKEKRDELHLGKEKESLSLPSKPERRGKLIWGGQVHTKNNLDLTI